jgi:hypothetical protein
VVVSLDELSEMEIRSEKGVSGVILFQKENKKKTKRKQKENKKKTKKNTTIFFCRRFFFRV